MWHADVAAQQPNDVRAVPFEGTDVTREFPAVTVDQYRGRKRDAADLAKRACRRIDVDAQGAHVVLVEVTRHRREAAAIDRQRDDLELRAPEKRLEPVERRKLLPAGGTPRSPEIEQDQAAPEVGQPQRLAVNVDEAEVGERAGRRMPFERRGREGGARAGRAGGRCRQHAAGSLRRPGGARAGCHAKRDNGAGQRPVHDTPFATLERTMDALEALLTRTSPPALTDPAPDDATMERLLQAAMRAPDHRRLRPWRFIIIDGEARKAFGEVLAQALRAREPGATEAALARERAKALRAPRIVVVAAVLNDQRKVPEIEQVIAAGAAAENLLVAAHASGFGGFWRTGPAAYDDAVKRAFGLVATDAIVGFLYLGTPVGTVVPPAPDGVNRVLHWQGVESAMDLQR